jgi:hypothetical protein
VGNLTPGFANTPGTLPHPRAATLLQYFYVARNGSWTQMLRMRWIEWMGHG